MLYNIIRSINVRYDITCYNKMKNNVSLYYTMNVRLQNVGPWGCAFTVLYVQHLLRKSKPTNQYHNFLPKPTKAKNPDKPTTTATKQQPNQEHKNNNLKVFGVFVDQRSFTSSFERFFVA